MNRYPIHVFLLALLALSPQAALAADPVPTSQPVSNVTIDDEALLAATRKGDELLQTAKWHVAGTIDKRFLIVDKTVLYWSHPANPKEIPVLLAVDRFTGEKAWEMKSDLVFVNPSVAADASDRGADLLISNRPTISLVDPTDRSVKWQAQFDAFDPLPIFAPSQVITGATLRVVSRRAKPGDPQGSGNGGGMVQSQPVVPMEVRAYDRLTGKPTWTWPLPAGTRSALTEVIGNHVYVSVAAATRVTEFLQSGHQPTMDKSALVSLNLADGKFLWSAPVDFTLSPPALEDNLLVCAGSEGSLIAFEAASGERKWHTLLSRDADPAKSTISTWSGTVMDAPPAIDNDQVLAPVVGRPNPAPVLPTGPGIRYGPGDGTIAGLTSFDLHTGKQSWYFRSIENPDGRFTTGRIADQCVLSNIQIHKNMIIADATGVGRNATLFINPQTACLDTQILGGSRSILLDGTLYVTITKQNKNLPPGLYAIPLDPSLAK